MIICHSDACCRHILSRSHRHITFSWSSSNIRMKTLFAHRRTFALMVAATATTVQLPKRASAAASVAAGRVAMVSNMAPLSSNMSEHLPLARRAMDFLDSSPDPFHAVETCCERLKGNGFTELSDGAPYLGRVQPGGRYFFTRDKSTLVAFAVGGQYKPGGGFKIIGGHTDSPNLKVKPRSKRSSSGYKQIAVECYGGGLWHTWFDRDLGISGRVLVRNSSGGIEQRLVRIDYPVLRISNLAIHLQTPDERSAFKVNKEDHLAPIIANEAKKALNKKDDSKGDDDEGCSWSDHHEPLLLELIASQLGVNVDDIADFSLNLYDCQRASLGGARSEFIHSARLDNLASCFMAIEGLVGHVEANLSEDEDIPLVVLFDHEEVGSSSATGAGSPIITEAVRRISNALNAGDGNPDLYASALHKSFVLSSDQAHSIHPNYASKHEKGHSPKMNKGMVIKTNSNQRYATNGITGFIIREVARKSGLPPVQEFVVRNDCACGSTIGPIISSNTGIRAIDMGCPQLSMHSIRETMGVSDLTNGLQLFKGFYKHFREVDSSLQG